MTTDPIITTKHTYREFLRIKATSWIPHNDKRKFRSLLLNIKDVPAEEFDAARKNRTSGRKQSAIRSSRGRLLTSARRHPCIVANEGHSDGLRTRAPIQSTKKHLDPLTTRDSASAFDPPFIA